MPNTITAEHFEMTESIKVRLQESLQKIRQVLGAEGNLSVVLSAQRRKLFSAMFKVRTAGRDLVAHGSGYDLHQSIHAATEQLIRQITDSNHKAVSKARRARSLLYL